MDLFAVVADTPAKASRGARSRIQLAKLGRFNHARYGRFSVTPDTFQAFIRNFDYRGGRIPIDLDHAPDKGGSSEAAGWITKLEADGNALYGEVEWTPIGEKAVSEKRYLFISPTWSLDFTDDEGKKLGPTLFAAALTNRPHFSRMAVVSLSSFSQDLAEEEDEESFDAKPGRCPCPDPKCSCDDPDCEKGKRKRRQEPDDLKGRGFVPPEAHDAFDAELARVFDAESVGPHARSQLKGLLKHYAGKPHPFTSCVRDNTKRFGKERAERVCATLKDIIRGTTKWRNGGEKGSFDSETRAAFEALSEAEIYGLVATLAEQDEASDSPRRVMGFTADIAQVFGLDAEATEEEVLTAARDAAEKAERAPGEGSVVMTAERATELEQSAEASRKELRDMRFDKVWSAALERGAVAPANKDSYVELFEQNEETTTKLLTAAQPIVSTEAKGGRGDDGEAPEGVDPESYQLDREVQAFAAQHNLDYTTALDRVLAQKEVAA